MQLQKMGLRSKQIAGRIYKTGHMYAGAIDRIKWRRKGVEQAKKNRAAQPFGYAVLQVHPFSCG